MSSSRRTPSPKPGSSAALLDGEMPPGLADDADAAGVSLLPGPQDLEPACNCPDWGVPCKHAAALCYQVARLLDRDPFVLLLLRGRGEHELTDELGRRNLLRAAAAAADADAAGVGAAAPPPATKTAARVRVRGQMVGRAPKSPSPRRGMHLMWGLGAKGGQV